MITKTYRKILGPDDTMPFGRYKGVKISEVLEHNVGYMYWIINNTQLALSASVQDQVVRGYISLRNSQRKGLNKKPYYDLKSAIFETMEEWL